MAKKRTKKIVEPKPVDEDEDLLIEDDDDDEVDNDKDDSGLTCTKRYTVSRFVPEKSYGGTRSYKDFYETDVLASAKKEAEKVLKEEKLEVTIWDREKWHMDPIRYIPEVKEGEDDKADATTKKSGGVRDVGHKRTTNLPKPKHPRKKRS